MNYHTLMIFYMTSRQKNNYRLQAEVEYLASRLSGLAELCRTDGDPIDDYVRSVLAFPATYEKENATTRVCDRSEAEGT